MTDRELLELAAKACGFANKNNPDNLFCWTESEYPKKSGKYGALWNYVGCGDDAELFNPLTDDGDALRLAVKLQLVIRPQERCVYVESNPESLLGQASVSELEMNGNDANDAARRAIVRAAAAIGESIK